MTTSKVWIIKQKSTETDQDTTLRALYEFNAKRLFNGTEKVLIKPNWIIAEHYSHGNTTSTDVVDAIIHYLLNECRLNPKNLIVGDGGYPGSTDDTIRINNVLHLQEKYGIIVKNLNNDRMIEKTKLNPLALKNFKMAKTFDEVDVIISVPALKVHSSAITTLSMKNLMGLLLPKGIMHSGLHKKIADLCAFCRSKMRFSLIAGIIGSDGYEEGGKPVPMGLILVSEDPVALDTVGSAVIGYGPDEALYLKYGSELKLGNCDLKNIEIIGPNIDDVKRKFDRY